MMIYFDAMMGILKAKEEYSIQMSAVKNLQFFISIFGIFHFFKLRTVLKIKRLSNIFLKEFCMFANMAFYEYK